MFKKIKNQTRSISIYILHRPFHKSCKVRLSYLVFDCLTQIISKIRNVKKLKYTQKIYTTNYYIYINYSNSISTSVNKNQKLKSRYHFGTQWMRLVISSLHFLLFSLFLSQGVVMQQHTLLLVMASMLRFWRLERMGYSEAANWDLKWWRSLICDSHMTLYSQASGHFLMRQTC